MKSELPDFVPIATFRYSLGRMTYVVGECVGWLIIMWPRLSNVTRYIIANELAEEIRRDDDARARHSQWKPLGWDCDRKEWLRLAEFIKGWKP